MKRILFAAVMSVTAVFSTQVFADDEEGLGKHFYIAPVYHDLDFVFYSGGGSAPGREKFSYEGWGVRFGIQLHEAIALEGFWTRLEEDGGGFGATNVNADPDPTLNPEVEEVDLYGLRVRGTAPLPMFDRKFRLHGVLEFSQFDDDDYDFENSKFGYGFGLSFRPFDMVELGADWIQHKDNNDTDNNTFRIKGGAYYLRFNVPFGGGGDDDDDDY